jgi:hypothetical protein
MALFDDWGHFCGCCHHFDTSNKKAAQLNCNVRLIGSFKLNFYLDQLALFSFAVVFAERTLFFQLIKVGNNRGKF